MSDEPEYEILPPEKAVESEPSPSRAVGFKTLGIATIIAALLGAGGGAGFSAMTEKPTADIAPLRADLNQAETANKNLKAQIVRLQQDIKAIPAPKSVNLTGIRARLEALETTETLIIDPDLVTRLEALKSEGGEIMDLADIYARLDALESQLVAAIQAAPPSAAPLIAKADIPPFPKEVLLAALNEQDKTKSWIKRKISQNVIVHSDDNPRFLIKRIIENISSGDMEMAVHNFDKLPSDIQAAGKTWRNAFSPDIVSQEVK